MAACTHLPPRLNFWVLVMQALSSTPPSLPPRRPPSRQPFPGATRAFHPSHLPARCFHACLPACLNAWFSLHACMAVRLCACQPRSRPRASISPECLHVYCYPWLKANVFDFRCSLLIFFRPDMISLFLLPALIDPLPFSYYFSLVVGFCTRLSFVGKRTAR